MIARCYCDIPVLDDYIAKSGLKISYLCDSLGISRTAFAKKRSGKAPFRVAEVFTLCTLLNIPLEDREKIFNKG